MMRHVSALIVLTLSSLLFISHEARAQDEAAERPNILFIFSDDHACAAVGAYGSVINKTPGIDRIAAEGMRFENCLVTNSICGPSRAVILTGKYSHVNGFMRNGNRFNGNQQTFPKLLQKAGYQTAVIGKWHLGTNPTGFDYWNTLIGQGPYYNPPMVEQGTRRDHIGYTTEVITDEAIGWLEKGRDPDRPFMLMLQHKAPHRAWQPGPKQFDLYKGETIPEPATLFDDYATRGTAAREQDMSIEKTLTNFDLKLTPPKNLTDDQLTLWQEAYRERRETFERGDLEGEALVRWKYQCYIKDYLRAVAAMDDGVSRVLDWLDESGLADDTVVVYASDQGFYLGEHGWFDKRFMYEPSLRTPLVVRWPGVVEPGSVNTNLVSNLDFAETFLAIAGVEIPRQMQGESLVPLLRGEDVSWRSDFYYHYYEYPGTHDVHLHEGIRTDRYKLINFYGLGEWELYDLDADPDELNNLYDDPDQAELIQGLKLRLKRLHRLYGVQQGEIQMKNPR